MNKKSIVIFICFGVLIIIILLLRPWISLYLGAKRQPDPMVPSVTYGEFPIKLEYQIEGQRFIVEDTIICEYDGIVWNEGRGKHRIWKHYLASNKEEKDIVLLELKNNTKIYYNVGDAAYYMGDAEKPIYINDPFNGVFVKGSDSSEFNSMPLNEMLEYFNITLIDWKESPPIENEFGS